MAETFETNEDVEIGDLLVMDSRHPNMLKKSRQSFDKNVIGIVSGAPAVLMAGDQLQVAPEPFKFEKGRKPPVALSGRVLCKISLENGSIEVGDLLTSSSTPGHAMKADDWDKSFGTIIGKALEPFNSKDKKLGTIMVMVTRQ